MKQYRDIALKIAIEAHKNQKDKAGNDFINHPIAVSKIIYDQFYESIENLAIINARPLEDILDLLVSASYLHDVLEDTTYTRQTLRAKGIPLEIIKIVELLTREKDSGQTYFEYINKISKNQFATIIKLADLIHNMDLSRFNGTNIINNSLLERYQKAYRILINNLNN